MEKRCYSGAKYVREWLEAKNSAIARFNSLSEEKQLLVRRDVYAHLVSWASCIGLIHASLKLRYVDEPIDTYAMYDFSNMHTVFDTVCGMEYAVTNFISKSVVCFYIGGMPKNNTSHVQFLFTAPVQHGEENAFKVRRDDNFYYTKRPKVWNVALLFDFDFSDGLAQVYGYVQNLGFQTSAGVTCYVLYDILDDFLGRRSELDENTSANNVRTGCAVYDLQSGYQCLYKVVRAYRPDLADNMNVVLRNYAETYDAY